MDRRFGENDPSMAPEDKMLERFTQEKQRRHKNSSAFDLEDDMEEGNFTHMGQSLSLDGPMLADDFDDEGLELSDAEDHPSDDDRVRKRRRSSQSENDEDDEDDAAEDAPERKKTKQEVMKEVVAKSKMYKYERQAVKDDDEDLREELDKEMSTLHALLRGQKPRPNAPPPTIEPGMNADRAAMLSGMDRINFDKEYDKRLRQLAQDQKAKPTERTKTEDEKIADNSRRLQELESKRLRRMQGDAEVSDDEPEPADDGESDDFDDFGLGAGIKTRPSRGELGVEDEDDFIIDDDLVASGSDIADSEISESDGEAGSEEEEEDDFVTGLLTEEESKRPEFLTGANAPLPEVEMPASNGVNGDLAYTFACPESHEELLEITKQVVDEDLPVVVQRIRALYHPKLKAENKGKLANFAVSLVDHLSYLANKPEPAAFGVVETLTRHVHSLAKMFPTEIANAFRRHLEQLGEQRALVPTPGDLVLLTGIGVIFPTSDHFHQVVTPAILSMARYLGQKIPQAVSEIVSGAYMATLCLQYQQLSKRYVPEVISFLLNGLCVLAPTKLARIPGSFPYHEPKQSLRLDAAVKVAGRRIRFVDVVSTDLSVTDERSLKVSLLETIVKIIDAAADTWSAKSAFTEVFEPALKVLQHLQGKSCRSKIAESTHVCYNHAPVRGSG